MSGSRKSSLSLLPVEVLLVGAWIALILLCRWLNLPPGEMLRIGRVELLLGVFLILLSLRRRAGGSALLLPFTLFTLALLFQFSLWPESVRIAHALHGSGAQQPLPAGAAFSQRWKGAAAILRMVEVLFLFGMFLSAYKMRAKR